jgi:hypothetical protein
MESKKRVLADFIKLIEKVSEPKIHFPDEFGLVNDKKSNKTD